jgi:hypothetical protein
MIAKPGGSPTWAIDIQPPGDEAVTRQDAMTAEIGPALIQLSAWTGKRASEGDQESIALMVRHLAVILQTGKEIIENNVADYRKN